MQTRLQKEQTLKKEQALMASHREHRGETCGQATRWLPPEISGHKVTAEQGPANISWNRPEMQPAGKEGLPRAGCGAMSRWSPFQEPGTAQSQSTVARGTELVSVALTLPEGVSHRRGAASGSSPPRPFSPSLTPSSKLPNTGTGEHGTTVTPQTQQVATMNTHGRLVVPTSPPTTPSTPGFVAHPRNPLIGPDAVALSR